MENEKDLNYSLSKEDELKMLFSLWNALDNNVTSLSKQLNVTSIISFLITLFTVIANLNANDNLNVNDNTLFLIYCIPIIPFVLFFIVGVFLYNLRIVICEKGYLAGIEDIIATITGKNIFVKYRGNFEAIYDSDYLNNVTIWGMIFEIILCVVFFCFDFMFQHGDPQYIVLIFIEGITLVVMSIMLIRQMIINDKTKNMARTYFHFIYNNKKTFKPDKTTYDKIMHILSDTQTGC